MLCRDLFIRRLHAIQLVDCCVKGVCVCVLHQDKNGSLMNPCLGVAA